jgi:hypothetical protein
MADEAHDKLVIRDVPYLAWFAAAVFLTVGLCSTMVWDNRLFNFSFMGAGVFILLFFGGISTFVADRRTRRIVVTNSLLLLPIPHRLSFDDVASVEVQRTSHTSDHHTSTSYRVALVGANGKDYPLTLVYGNGRDDCQQRANQIRRYIGLAHRQAPTSRVVWAGETAPPAQESEDPQQ